MCVCVCVCVFESACSLCVCMRAESGNRAEWKEEGGGINSVGMRVCPVRSVQRTILNGFCKVMRFDGFGIRQIGNGSGDFQYSVVGSSRQPQPFHGMFHQTIPVTVELAIGPDFTG